MMDFSVLLERAKAGDQECISEIMEMYRPLLSKASVIGGVFSEDLYQDLQLVLLHCIQVFKIHR